MACVFTAACVILTELVHRGTSQRPLFQVTTRVFQSLAVLARVRIGLLETRSIVRRSHVGHFVPCAGTTGTVKATDAITQALALTQEELTKWREYVQDLSHAEAALSSEMVRSAGAATFGSLDYRLLTLWSLQRAKRQAALADGKPLPSLVPVPQHNPLLLGLTPTRYLLREIQDIRPADLEEVCSATHVVRHGDCVAWLTSAVCFLRQCSRCPSLLRASC